MSSPSSSNAEHSNAEHISIIGFGSLLSERSARSTFPNLRKFRLGYVPTQQWRRVFGHPAAIFFQRGIANMESKEISSLSCEKLASGLSEEGGSGGERGPSRMIVTLFEIPRTEMDAFYAREEEFLVQEAQAFEYQSTDAVHDGNESESIAVTGLLCTRWTDEAYIAKYGREHFDSCWRNAHGIEAIWHWESEEVCARPLNGMTREKCDPPRLLPCAPYLRHCLLAAKAWGGDVYENFLDTTWLSDRATTLRTYVEKNEQAILSSADHLPDALKVRYGG